MKKIMILGMGPLTHEVSNHFHGGGNRAWHLTKPLLDKGFEVILVCMRITGESDHATPPEEIQQKENLTYYSVDEIQRFSDDAYLRSLIEKHRPDALIGACDYPAARAVSVADNLPVWADIHGYPLGEAQAKAYHYDEPGFLHHFWNIHRPVLRRGDRFSVTSERQRMTLIGELGTMARLNGYTFEEPLVTQIPIAWDINTPYHFQSRKPEDEFIVFFCGGYNLWCDVDTLFAGLEHAMKQDSRIRFLSTGGAIEGHDEKTYPRFVELVNQSPMRARFDLRGWVSREQLEKCFRRAHLGINVDRPCYETLIGARNRITEFMARGIPILTTLGTEISQILFYKNRALSVPIGKTKALSNEIILAAQHPERMQSMAQDARNLFEHEYTYHTTTYELIEWCKNPVHAGDFSHPPIHLDYRFGDESPPPPPSLLQRVKQWLRKN